MSQWERKLHWSRDWLERELIEKRRTLRDIGTECGVTYEAIRRMACKFGLYKPPIHLTVDAEWLRQEFVEKRRSQYTLAVELGVSRKCIGRVCKEYGIVRLSYTSEERAARNLARQKQAYATDAKYRAMKQACALRWRKNNPERYKAYQRMWARRRYARDKIGYNKGGENDD